MSWHFCLAIMLASVGVTSQSADSLTRDQLLRLLRSYAATIRDVEFLYEGSMRYVGQDRIEKRADFEADYQGSVAMSGDNPVHLLIYVRSVDASHPIRQMTMTLADGQLSERAVVPDMKPEHDRIKSGRASIGTLDQPYCALRMLRSLELVELLNEESQHYRFLGWDAMEGSRVAEIELYGSARGGGGFEVRRRFWIDIERGAVPVRVELWRGDSLLSRTSRVAVREVRTEDGLDVWFPVSAVHHSFLKTLTEYSASPVFEETYDIIRGTLRVNQGLPRSRFSMDWTPSSNPLSFAQIRSSAPPHRDARGRLDQIIADAEHGAELLQASSTSRMPWYRRYMIEAAIGAFGLLCVGAGIYVWRKLQ